MVKLQGISRSLQSKSRKAAFAAVAVLGLVSVGALTVPTAQAAPPSTHFAMGVPTGDIGNATVKQTRRTDGYTVASVVQGNIEVRASAPNGSAFDLTTSSADDGKTGSISSSVTTPDDKGNGVDPMKVVAENKRLGRSVITEVMTMGVSYEEAVRDFGSMMSPEQIPTKAAAERTVALSLGKSTSYPATSLAAAAPTIDSATLTTADTGTYYDTSCKEYYIDGAVHMRSCDVRYLDYKGSNGQWYLHHRMQNSAQYDSLWSALDYTYMYVNYASGGTGDGNKWVEVDPYTTTNVGSCYTATFNVEYQGFGGSYSKQICPQSVGPKYYTHGYGVYWDGLSSYWRGSHGMGVVDSPPGAPVSREVHNYMEWQLK